MASRKPLPTTTPDLTPLAIEFSEDLNPSDVATDLRSADGQEISVEMTTWETVDNQDN